MAHPLPGLLLDQITTGPIRGAIYRIYSIVYLTDMPSQMLRQGFTMVSTLKNNLLLMFLIRDDCDTFRLAFNSSTARHPNRAMYG